MNSLVCTNRSCTAWISRLVRRQTSYIRIFFPLNIPIWMEKPAELGN